eukprot:COSAG02_NODE_5253_length_4494_cov_4.888510_2_plen_73_part_00
MTAISYYRAYTTVFLSFHSATIRSHCCLAVILRWYSAFAVCACRGAQSGVGGTNGSANRDQQEVCGRGEHVR